MPTVPRLARVHLCAIAEYAHAIRMKLLLVAAAAIMREQGGTTQLLLAQRPKGKALAGLWEFPGGKMEPGEQPEACLVRELKEELDIEVDVGSLIPITFASHQIDGEKHLLMPLWRVDSFKGEPVGAEGQQLAWVEADALATYDMPPADIPLILPVQRAMDDFSRSANS